MAGEIDVPYLYGVHSTHGWRVATTSTADRNKRCSNALAPPLYGNAGSVSRWWSGNFMHIPGQGDQELLARRSNVPLPMPSNGTYPWVTKSNWRISCLATTANGYPGEAFVAISPEGVTYTFNYVISRNTTAFGEIIGNGSYGSTPRSYVPRAKVFFVATKVEDPCTGSHGQHRLRTVVPLIRCPRRRATPEAIDPR